MKNRFGFINKENAITLRYEQTDAEKILWAELRNRKYKGIKFRRQEPIGIYIADFVTFDKKIIIEIDGSGHNEEAQIAYDKERTQYLESLGFKAVRFWNNDVINNLKGVFNYLDNYL